MLAPRDSFPGLEVAALLWATFIVALHIIYAFQRIPVGLGKFVHLLPSELALGPELFHFWIRHTLRLGACFSLFLGAWALGECILERWFRGFQGQNTTGLSKSIFGLGLGLGALSYVAFLLAALAMAHRVVFIGLFVLLCILGYARAAKTLLGMRHQNDRSPRTILSNMEKVVLGLLGVALAVAFLGTTIPEIFYDALVYHLAVPQMYLFAGRMVDLPYNHYSYLPLLSSMLHLWSLSIGGMYAAKLVNFFVGVSVIAGIFAFGKELGGRSAALLACVLFAGTPIVLYLFWMTNSEFGAALFLLLMLWSFWLWTREPEANRRWLYLSGLYAGFAVASKYTAGFGAICLVLASAWICWKKRNSIGILPVGLFIVLLVLPLAPWWTRNYLFQGNPFLPYLAETLRTENTDPELLHSWYVETREGSPGIQPVQHLRKTWHDAVLGFEYFPYHNVGPIFLAFFPLTFLVSQIPVILPGIGYFIVTYFSGLSATYITRLLIPYFVPLCILLALAVHSASAKPINRAWMSFLLVLTLASNIYRFTELVLLTSIKGLSVASGRMSSAQYLRIPRNWYPNPSYGAYEHITQLGLGPHERVLVIGDSRIFYSPSLTIASAPYDIPVVFMWANEARNPRELHERMKSENVSVVVVNRLESERKDTPKYANRRGVKLLAYMCEHYFKKSYEDATAAVYVRESPAD